MNPAAPPARPRRRSWSPVRIGLALVSGLLLYQSLVVAFPVMYLGFWKLSGRVPACTWGRILTMRRDAELLGRSMEEARGEVFLSGHDAALDLDLIGTRERSFWVKRKGKAFDGRGLVAYLLAEHRWMMRVSPAHVVRRGDVVIDGGAHVGIFTHQALRQGAAKVIAIEPDPGNLHCLRRNFAAEIASGRVVVVPEGLWSRRTTLELFEGVENSGTNSLIWKHAGNKVRVPVTTLDLLVERLELERVNFIKMDIEGAEREALKGAFQTLRRHRPRLMLDTYHRPDDTAILPAILKQAHAGYIATCGPCQPAEQSGQPMLIPHVTYYQ